MRTLAALHRWWGVAFCLLFAMWFASGIVMHFVPFPARNAGAAADPKGAIDSERNALSVAIADLRSRGLDGSRATVARIDYDQWTVAGDYDSDRPLYWIALHDDAGTELYVSSGNGKVVLVTTRKVRIANYAGSIVHWIYPTPLRHHRKAWSELMWWLSLLATLGAALGVIIGLIRLGSGPAYQGLQRWHHIFGIVFAPFILLWILSGFLTMNDGGLLAHNDALFHTLHTLDFPPFVLHPWLRACLIIALCLCGLGFSLSGAGLACRRLRLGPADRREP